jgi:hypothetical protein
MSYSRAIPRLEFQFARIIDLLMLFDTEIRTNMIDRRGRGPAASLGQKDYTTN